MISIVDGQILSMAFIESLASNFLFLFLIVFFFFGGGGSLKTNRIIQSLRSELFNFFYYDFFPQPTMFLAKT